MDLPMERRRLSSLPITCAFAFLAVLTATACLLIVTIPPDNRSPNTWQWPTQSPVPRIFGNYFKQTSQPNAQYVVQSDAGPKSNDNKKRVPMEMHIMSKCPDARDCMELLVAPAMEQVSDIVDLKMSFIGKAAPNGGVSCKHGPGECLGNMLHLCAQRLYPLHTTAGNATFLPFSQCLLHDYEALPKEWFVRSCAKQAGLDFHKLNECASDLGEEGGIQMLRESVEYSAAEGVTTSCTVRILGKIRCIRDGGEWKECDGGSEVEDLVRDLKSKYNSMTG